MTEQEKRQKVIKGLECCTKKVCIYKDTEKQCPYWELCGEYEDSFEDCTTALSKDAIALLKSQEPRVMTMDEVVAAKQGTTVWLEDCDKHDVIVGLLRDVWITTNEIHSVAVLLHFVVVRGQLVDIVTALAEGYGIRWRCWTSWPDEKAREETPWN